MPYVSISFLAGSFWKSSTDPSEDRYVDEAEAVGESSGVLAVEFDTVEGVESTVTVRLMADRVARAVVLILAEWCEGERVERVRSGGSFREE